MNAATGVLRQCKIPGHRHGFRCFGYPGQAQAACHRTFVGAAVVAQMLIFSAQHNQYAEGGCVFQGAPFDQGICQRQVGITECDTACQLQCCHLTQLIAFQVLAQCAHRQHSGVADALSALAYQCSHRGGIDHRIGIRRTA